MSEPEANERGGSLIGRRTHFLRNASDCGRSKNKGATKVRYGGIKMRGTILFHRRVVYLNSRNAAERKGDVQLC